MANYENVNPTENITKGMNLLCIYKVSITP